MLDIEPEFEQVAKKEVISSADVLLCVGKEPSFNNVALTDADYEKKYVHGLNWANYALDVEELKTHTLEYVARLNQKTTLESLKNVKASRFMHVGKICYLANSNCPLTDASKQKITEYVVALLDQLSTEVIVQTVEVTKVSKADIKASKLNKQIQELVSLIDEKLDELIINEKEPLVYSVLNQLGVETHLVRECESYYKNRYNTLLEELKSLKTDIRFEEDELRNYTQDLDKQLIALDHMLPDLSCYLGNNKAKRSTKSSKTKKTQTQVQRVIKTVKFKTHDANLKIQSVPLDRVLGSQMLLVFNSKNRKLSMYYAKDETGLQIKGTTLLNYDETKSVQKTLRDPEKLLSHLQQNSDHRASIVFRDLSTHTSETNGRLNEHTILLKAFKILTKI